MRDKMNSFLYYKGQIYKCLLPGLLAMSLLYALPCHAAAEYKYPGNNKVMIFAPGYDYPCSEEVDQKGLYDIAKDTIFPMAKFFNVQPDDMTGLKNTDASVEAVKSFGQYGTVIIHTHGWFTDPENPERPDPNKLAPGFRTGTIKTPSVELTYEKDLQASRLVVSKRPMCDNYHLVVFPKFIETHITSPMQNTFLYLGYCHSLQNDKMWQTFKAKGAKAAVGFSEEVFSNRNEALFSALMSRMFPADETIRPMAVQEAFNEAVEAFKNTPRDINDITTGEPVQYFDTDWENFIYLPFPMILHPEGKNVNYMLYQPDQDAIRYEGIGSDGDTFYGTNFGFVNYTIIDAPIYKDVPETLWPLWMDNVSKKHQLPSYRHGWSYYTQATNYAFVVFRDSIKLPEETRVRLQKLNSVVKIGMNYWIDSSLTGYAKDVIVTVKPGYLAEEKKTAAVIPRNTTLSLTLQNTYGVFDINMFASPVFSDSGQENVFFKIIRSAELIEYEYGTSTLEMPVIILTGVKPV